MNSNATPAVVSRLTPKTVQTYAAAVGWEPVRSADGAVALYRHPNHGNRQLLVPLDADLGDFAERMWDAVVRIADFEGRPVGELLNHLLMPSATDLLRVREVSPEADAGSITLEHAARLIEGVRMALLAVAHSVIEPATYYPRLRRAEAERYVGRCRFGQTERGSFVMTLACPLEISPSLFGPAEVPFGRRVTSLLMDTLSVLTSDPLGGDQGYAPDRFPGLSANLCEALADLRPAGEQSRLDVSADWSRAYLPGSDRSDRTRRIELGQGVFDRAELLAPQLQLQAVRTPVAARFYGRVDGMDAVAYDPAGRPAGDVRFTLYLPEGELRARGYLGPDDYKKAGDAHLENESALISFRGVLVRSPRVSRVDQITQFRRVDLDSPQSATA